MKNTKNKNLFQNLDSFKAVEELSDKAAATCAGGYSIEISGSSFTSEEVFAPQPLPPGTVLIGFNGNIG